MVRHSKKGHSVFSFAYEKITRTFLQHVQKTCIYSFVSVINPWAHTCLINKKGTIENKSKNSCTQTHKWRRSQTQKSCCWDSTFTYWASRESLARAKVYPSLAFYFDLWVFKLLLRKLVILRPLGHSPFWST